MTLEDFRLWLPIAIAVSVFAWNIYLQRSGVRQSALDKVNARVDQVEAERAADANNGRESREKVVERLTALEQQLQHMPDKDTVHRLELSVTRMEGDVKAQSATMVALSENVKAAVQSSLRVETYMLESRK
ncbi:MAG: DUF2730 family protein [Bauldia sp.]